MSESAFNTPSFAKVNLSLRILGRREDGYHEIRTVLQTVSLQDDLNFASRDDGKVFLFCNDPAIPSGEDNLIVQAANALRGRFGISAGATIHLDKRIPAKAGLGGGSSNAAVALLGLRRLWTIDARLTDLLAIASELGADVPFFLVGGRAVATGIGTSITPIRDQPRQHLVIVVPNTTVSTADAYKALRVPALTTSDDASILSSSRAGPDSGVSDPWAMHNDFEQVIFEREPEIESARNALIEVGARGSLLAGSGSSVFGIFESRAAQAAAVKRIQTEKSWRVIAGDTVSREEYLRALGSCGVPL